MSVLSDIGTSVITAVTGTNPQEIQNQLSAAEQVIAQVTEVIVVILAIIAVELAFIVRNTRR